MKCHLQGIRRYRIEYICLAVLLVYVFLTMCYQDLTVAARFGVTFVESLFDGEPLSFYYNSNNAGFNVEGANYDILYFILYGIWDLPVTILAHTIGIDTASAGCLMWYKVPIILALLASIYEICQIAHLLGVDPERDAEITLIALTTATFFYPVMIACQCDILSVLPCLIATRALFEDNIRVSVIWFAISLLIKPLVVFWMILAVLYYHRNIVRIVLDCIMAVLPLAITRLAYDCSPSHPHARQPSLSEDPSIFYQLGLPIDNDATASVFILLFLGLCIIAYLHRGSVQAKQDRLKFLLLLYALWTAFLFTVSIAPNWIAYAAPITVLLVVLLGDADVLLLEFVGSMALMVHHMLLRPWVYGGGMTYYYLVMGGLFSDREQAASGSTVAGILRTFNIQNYEPIVNAVSLGCYLAIGYIAYRRLYKEEPVQTDTKPGVISTRVVIWLRILGLYGFVAATIVALMKILRG